MKSSFLSSSVNLGREKGRQGSIDLFVISSVAVLVTLLAVETSCSPFAFPLRVDNVIY